VQTSPRENYFPTSLYLKKCVFVAIIQKDTSFIKAVPREQLMLPCSLDEYVSREHFVRFIDAFVDKVLSSRPILLFQKGKSVEGRPSTRPIVCVNFWYMVILIR